MIKLIKNELTKIFHKKSIYIMLIIMFASTVSGIFLSFVLNDELINSIENYSYDYSLKYLEEDLKNYDLSKKDERETYIISKTEYLAIKDRIKFKERYKKDYVDEYAYDYIQCEVENEVNGNKEEEEECRRKHNEIIQEIENNDWKFFVEKDIKELDNKIKEIEDLSQDELLDNYKTQRKALEYQLKYNISPNDSKMTIINQYMSSKNSLKSYENRERILSDEEKEGYKTVKANYRISEYKLENNLLYNEYGTLMSLDSLFKGAGFFVIITMTLIAGSIVSDEFNKGTIKQLLIRPHTRSKILLSKLITVFIVFIIVLLFHYILNILSSVITGDAKEIFMPIIRYNFNTDTVYEQNVLLSMVFGTLKILPCYLIVIIFSFLASTVTKNDALGILAGIGLYFGGNILNLFLSIRKLWINDYVPTLCWDLNSYLSYGESLSNIILPLVVDLLTIGIMITISFIVFKKIDIKNQ